MKKIYLKKNCGVVIIIFLLCIVNINAYNENENKTANITWENLKILDKNEISKLYRGISTIENVMCRKELNDILYGISNNLTWAFSFFDASVKSPNGLESGSLYQFGNFDECIDNIEKIPPKYCLVDVIVNGLELKHQALRPNTIQHINSTILKWGVCVPASCLTENVQDFMRSVLNFNIIVQDNQCYFNKDLNMTKPMTIYASILFCFILIIILGTCYHVIIICICKAQSYNIKSNSYIHRAILSFSVIENLIKLCQKGNDYLNLNTINGIKAISMLFIISGHALLFMIGGPVINTDFYSKHINLIQNAFLLNSTLFVDTFLLLSGFLFARILLHELDRRKGKINFLLLYVFRYIRLTPAYLAIIGLYSTWLYKIGSGPIWNNKIILEQERCIQSGWLNILYINNYSQNDKLCMFQSWYLSVDTQLFIISSPIIYILWKKPKMGLFTLSILILFSILIPFIETYFYNYDPTLLAFVNEVEDISSNKYFNQVYIKTHMRINGYIIGLFTGYIAKYLNEKNLKISKVITMYLWIMSGLIGAASMFSITFFLTKPFTQLESALYASFHRFGWNLANSWLVIASTTGNAGYLTTFLSSRVFAPISRLTFCAYLTNGLVELYKVATIRTPLYMSIFTIVNETMSHIGLTFLAALLLCLLFESPIHGIEKILLALDKREHPRTINQNEEPQVT